SRFIDLFEQVCQTVAYAHSKQILHRDLKPANIMVGSFGEVQVMDWGLGKLLDAEVSLDEPAVGDTATTAVDSTVPGFVIGTYPYLAPEQATGDIERVSQRSDVFGLGGILCEILTGQPPYTSPDLRKKAEEGNLGETFQRLSRCGADKELIAIAEGCLARAPEARFAHAGEVAAQIAQYRSAAQSRLDAARMESEKATARLAAEHKALDAERRRTRIARWAMALGLTLAAVAIVSSFVVFNANRKTEEAVQRAARLAFGQG